MMPDRGNSVRPFPARRESGQTLVILALMTILLVLVAGLALDGAGVFAQRRQMQVAADAAALAGAGELSQTAPAVWARVNQYATSNRAAGFSATYLPDGEAVASLQPPPAAATGVCVTTTVGFAPAFMHIAGITDVPVAAHACAECVRCMGGAAVWADGRDGVSGIRMSGSNAIVNGVVHANTDIRISGSKHTFNGMCEWVASFSQSGSGYTYNPSAGNPARVAAADMPVSYNMAAYRPGGAAATAAAAEGKYHQVIGDLRLSGSGQTLDGLYYVTGNVQVSGSNLSGTCTIVAEGEIGMSGSGRNLSPYYGGLLLLSNSAGVDMSGSGSTWQGVIYAPQGTVDMSGANNTTVEGSIFARAVSLSGSGLRISYQKRYCPPGSRRARLVQ